MNQKDTIELLLKNGADISLKDKKGETSLEWAESLKQHEIIQLLREHDMSK